MRCCWPFFALVVLSVGCRHVEETRRQSPESNSQRSETAESDDTPRAQSATPQGLHRIAAEAPYYIDGPQQGRPPDGKFTAGTRIDVIRVAGSYVLVRSANGTEAYVATDSVQPELMAAGNLPRVADGVNLFAVDLYRQLRTQQGNLLFSPSSVSIALAMTYAGAAGQTEAEIANALHFPMPKDELPADMKALREFWNTIDQDQNVQLKVASRLWGREQYEFLSDYLAVTRDQYAAEVARLNFAHGEEARQAINRWVADRTEDKIADLVTAGGISSDTKLVLTNAVYFKGKWSQPFDKRGTRDEEFHLTETRAITVPMMHSSPRLRYGQTEDLQVLELPYGTGSVTMIVLLPAAVDGLGHLEQELTSQKLQQWTASLKSARKVQVYLPKFKVASRFELSDALRMLGVRTAFDAAAANFSGMTGSQDLFISAVLHQAFIDVDEQGTEATAATGVVMEPTGSPVSSPTPPVFRADHPFLFVIRDRRIQAILFVGRISNPLNG